MPRAGRAMTLLCHIVGEGLGWALVQSPLQTSSRPAGLSSMLKAQLQPHSCASVGSHLGACSECGIHHCCHSLLGRNAVLFSLGAWVCGRRDPNITTLPDQLDTLIGQSADSEDQPP